MLATEENVLEAILFGPNGAFQVVKADINRRLGPAPDSIGLSVLSLQRLKTFKEFPGSFVRIQTNSGFARFILPEPKTGIEFEAMTWRLEIDPPKDSEGESTGEKITVGPLILLEATTEKYDKAETPLGPAIPDAGEAREEQIRLTFADPRAFWGTTGHVSGRRNFVDRDNPFGKLVFEPEEEIKIDAPVIEFEKKEELDGSPSSFTIVTKPPKEVTLNLGPINDIFDPASINEEKLFTMKELIEQIVERCPLVDNIGPADTLKALAKVRPLNIDWGVGTTPAQAFDFLAKEFGLVFGLQLDGELIVEFDAIPSVTNFNKSGVLGRQLVWEIEDRAGKVTPRSPAYRFYPKTVIKEVLLTDFIPAVKAPDGRVVLFTDFVKELGLSENEAAHIAYGMGSKTEVEHVTFGTLTEELLGGGPARTGTVSLRKTTEDKIRVLSDHGFKAFAYRPFKNTIDKVAKIAKDARAARQIEFREKVLAASDFGEGGKKSEEARGTLNEFDFKAMLDKLLAPPLNIITKLPALPSVQVDVSPRFFADVPLRRMYECFQLGKSIIFEAGRIGGNIAKRVTQNEFIVRAITLADEKKYLDTMNRRPSDWSEAKSKAKSFQFDWLKHGGQPTGEMNSTQLIGFWFLERQVKFGRVQPDEQGDDPIDPDAVEEAFEYLEFVESLRAPPEIETILQWISADASDFVKSVDPKTGFTVFDRPVGLFFQSKSTRRMMELSRDFLTEIFLEPRFILPSGFRISSIVTKTLANLWRVKIIIMLDEDKVGTDRIFTADGATPVFEKAQSEDPSDFTGIIEAYQSRSPKFPVWIFSSLQVAQEQPAKEAKVKGTPGAVLIPKTQKVT